MLLNGKYTLDCLRSPQTLVAPRPIQPESLGEAGHQYFLRFSRWFQWAARIEYYCSKESHMLPSGTFKRQTSEVLKPIFNRALQIWSLLFYVFPISHKQLLSVGTALPSVRHVTIADGCLITREALMCTGSKLFGFIWSLR